MQHEVRLLSNRWGANTNSFINALAEGISRYQGTTRMAGSVREYRDAETGRVIGFAHEVAKGRYVLKLLMLVAGSTAFFVNSPMISTSGRCEDSGSTATTMLQRYVL